MTSRPDAAETIAIVQAALQDLAREAASEYARAQANLCLMLLQSLLAELDTAAHDLASDIASLRRVLSRAGEALASLADGEARSLAADIGRGLEEPGDPSDLRLSTLRARRERLLALLERFLCLCEERADAPDHDTLLEARRQAYGFLRRAALRGWTFWDASSFREAVARWREAAAAGEP